MYKTYKNFSTAVFFKRQLREQQNQGFQEIMNKLNSGLIAASHEAENSEEKELVEKSMENSIDSMLSSFGLD